MKKLIISLIIIFLLATIIGFLFSLKRIYKSAVIKIAYDVLVNKPKEVPPKEIEKRINAFLLGIDKNVIKGEDLKQIDSILGILSKKELDSSSFMNLLIKLDNFLPDSILRLRDSIEYYYFKIEEEKQNKER